MLKVQKTSKCNRLRRCSHALQKDENYLVKRHTDYETNSIEPTGAKEDTNVDLVCLYIHVGYITQQFS